MTYLVLARKWRPRSFDTLVGQDHVVRALTHALDTQRLHHAWLFTGTRGVGKTTLSRILAKSLNCETGITAQPCGQCRACTEIDAGRYVDYVELDAASNRGVEEMTQLLEQAVYAPSSARFKVYMIDEVHMLTGHAFNAMLKTLEEPPPHVKFILATTDPQKIPVTVLSRCLQFNLKHMTVDAIVDHLQSVLAQEALTFELPALRLLGQAAGGSMRDALSLTDQAIAYSAGNLTLDAVQGMLGTIDQRHLLRLLQALAAAQAADVLAVADELATRGLSYAGALADLAVMLSRIAIQQRVPGALPDDDPLAADIAALASKLHPDLVQLYYSVAVHSRSELALAPDEYAGFVMACLRMLSLTPESAQAPEPPPSGRVDPAAQPAAARPSDSGPAAKGADPDEPDVPAWEELPQGSRAAAQPESAAAQPAARAGDTPRLAEPAVPSSLAGAVAAQAAPEAPSAPAPTSASTPEPEPASEPAASRARAATGAAAADAQAATGAPASTSEPGAQGAGLSGSTVTEGPATPPVQAQAAVQIPETQVPETQAAAQVPETQAAAQDPETQAVTQRASAPHPEPQPDSGLSPDAPVSRGSNVSTDDAPASPSGPDVSTDDVPASAGSDMPTDEADIPDYVMSNYDDAWEPVMDEADDLGGGMPPEGMGGLDLGADLDAADLATASLGVAALAPLARDQASTAERRPRLARMKSEDWPQLAASLHLTGLADELARQSEWVGVEGDTITLRVAIWSLAAKQGQARLCTVLTEHFGKVVKLKIEFGATGAGTARAVEQERRAERQKAAEAAVESDPLILSLIEEFGARVMPGSITALENERAA